MNEARQAIELNTATIELEDGLRATILDRGATLTSISVPGPDGRIEAILTYPDLLDYRQDTYCLGATVGPYANRIRDGRFALDGVEYALQRNEEGTGHCLHSGDSGLHRRTFELDQGAGQSGLTCRTSLADGDGGFPGNREVIVEYQLLGPMALAIDFQVTSDRPTVVSLANHAYFNLGGPIEDHELTVYADAYTPVDSSNAPTGDVCSVEDSRFDLRSATRIGWAVYDHNFALSGSGREPRLAASLSSPASGLTLNLKTTQPGLQLYTSDHLEAPFRSRQGVCLEAQGFPDAPNQPGFPSARVEAGETYRQRTIYEFAFLKD